MNGDWRNAAACRYEDRELFFGPDGETPLARRLREAQAKAVCAGCPVASACLDDAIATGCTDGIWGGHAEADLARLRMSIAHRRIGAAAVTALTAAGEKTCTQCGPVHGPKPLSEFSRAGDGWQSRCKACRAANRRQPAEVAA